MNRPTLAFAGDIGSFGEDAVTAYLPDAAARPVESFRDAFRAVADGAVDGAAVPIENVAHGTIREVYDLLLEHRLAIVGEVEVPVRLCLAALPGQSLDDIERVYSHVQALAQAEPFLRSGRWTLFASTSTAGAARQIVERHERGAAAVLSARAAAVHGLVVLRDGIESVQHNRTRFLVLAPERDAGWLPEPAAGASTRTTLAFATANEPGSLLRVLTVLADRAINVSKLESRPSRERAWEYVFWVDLDADLCRLPQALEDLDAVTAWVRLMGCYPRTASPDQQAGSG